MGNAHASELAPLLDRAARATGEVVRGITDGDLGRPTPCATYDVHALLNHLFHVVVQFQTLAAKGAADFSTTPEYLEGDWRARFGEETGRLVEAWSAPGALEGTSQGMGMPQRTVAHMVLGDLTIHGWDLARATGQSYTPDEAALAELVPAFGALAPLARKMGQFGEEVPVAEGAAPMERLLGGTGREPGWLPR